MQVNQRNSIRYCPQCGQSLVETTIDHGKYLACADKYCGYVFWNNPIPVVAALVLHNGKYIVANNTRWPSEIFSVITGYLEEGESPDKAILREVKEELNLDGRIMHPLGLHMLKEKNQLIIAYEVEGNGNLRLNEELSEIKCLSPTELERYDFKPLYITEAIVKKWLNIHFDDVFSGTR